MSHKRLALVGLAAALLAVLVAGCGKAEPAADTTTAAPTAAAPSTGAPAAAPVTAVAPGTIMSMDVDTRAIPGAAETPKPGGTLRYIGYDPLGWDQARTTSHRTYRNTAMVYATLLSLHNDPSAGDFKRINGQQIEPWFAESWHMENDLTYVFHLQKGVRFKENAYTRASPVVNEREATCDDVKFTIERQQSPQTGNPETIYRLADIQSVTCTDPYTAVFKLKAPLRTLLVNLTYQPSFILAREVLEKYGDYVAAETAIGFGPFTLEEATPNVRYVYRKNPDFFIHGKPYVDFVEMQVLADPAAQLAALRTGKWDIHGVSVTQLDSVMKSNPELYFAEGLTASGGYWMAMKTDRPPFNDIKVRQAVALAIDWAAWTEARTRGKGFLNAAFGPAYGEYFLPFEEWPAEAKALYSHNPTRAQQLLTEAGYPNGFSVTLNGTNGYGNLPIQDMEFVASQLEKVGIKASISIKEYGAFMATTFIGDFEGMAGPSPYHGYLDPNEYLYFMYYPGMLGNLGNVDDPVLNKMLEDQLRMKYGSPESVALLKEIQAYVVTVAYRFHAPNVNSFMAWHPWVKNFGAPSMGAPGCGGNAGPYFLNIWLDDSAPGRQYVPVK